MSDKVCGDGYFQGRAQTEAFKTVRGFLQSRGAAGGGMLLVSGARGVGKSSLVDQALNARRVDSEKPGFCEWMRNWARRFAQPVFGHDPCRYRLEVKRAPRGMRRVILPVNVDPFFPRQPCNADPGKPVGEEDELTLIHNLVFALTSELDSRLSTRQFGKTLGHRLGGMKLWFTRTALLRPQGIPGFYGVLISTLIAWFLGTYVARLVCASLGVVPLDFSALLTWHLPLSLSTTWLLLRYLDLRAVTRMGGQLYDLVHAQAMAKDVESRIDYKTSVDANWRRFLTVGSGLALMGTALFGDVLLGQPLVGAPVLMILGLLGAGTTLWGLTRKIHRHASFGNANRAWMITLLRRYLFLLHRAGLEPILILDEIDKLQNSTADPKSEPDKSSPSEYQRFVTAICRIKQSLGADFLWILIDNHRLMETVHKDRSNPLGYGPTATLIRHEIVLGPLPYGEFLNFAKERLADKFATWEAWLPHWWLMSHGVFLTLNRHLDEAQQQTDTSQPPPRASEARLLTVALTNLVEDDFSEFVVKLGLPPKLQPAFRARIATDPILRNWVWQGLLGFATRLYDPTSATITLKQIMANARQPGLDPNWQSSPEVLMKMSERVLFDWLRVCFMDGFNETSDSESIAKGNGINITAGQQPGINLRVGDESALTLSVT